MSVTRFNWIHDGRDGGDSIDGEQTRTRVARVWTNNPLDAEAVILAAADANGAAIGAAHPDGSGAFLQRRQATNASNSKLMWLLTCHYSDRQIDDPLLDPADIDSDTEKLSRLLIRDRNGNWVGNSAGFPYDPPAEVDDSRTTFRVSKNVAGRPAWYPNGYRDAVNSDVFTIDGLSVAIGKAKMMSLGLSKWNERNGVPYRVLSFVICVAELGWDVRLLDAGYYELDPSNTANHGLIVDDRGNQVSQPWPLNGAGRKLANPSPANWVFRTHEAYQQQPFAALPLV